MLTVSVVTVCHYTTYYNIIDPLPFAVLFIPVASSFYSWSLNFLILFVCFASPLVSLPLGNHQFVLRVNESVNMKQYLSLLHGRHSNFYFIKKKMLVYDLLVGGQQRFEKHLEPGYSSVLSPGSLLEM